jgi:hypothetical protein
VTFDLKVDGLFVHINFLFWTLFGGKMSQVNIPSTSFLSTHGLVGHMPQPNLTQDMVSHTQQKSINAMTSVQCVLTLPNPGYGQSHPADVNQPMD